MPPEPLQPAKVPVGSEVVEPRSFRGRLTLFGRVEPRARHPVPAPASGQLGYPPRFAAGLRTGEAVREGEPLFALRNPDLDHALAEARLLERSADAELARARRGVEAGFLAEVDLRRREVEAELARERLANAEARLRELEVAAPATGFLVVDRSHPPGTEVAAGTLVAEIAAAGLPKVEAFAAASDLEALRRGMEVECLTPNGPTLVARGRVMEVARQVERSGSVRVVVEVLEDLGTPAPGAGLELQVLMEPRPAALTVPDESLVRSGGTTALYVLEPSGEDFKAVRRLVQTGAQGEGRTEILDGLSAGERVATRGVELLVDGAVALLADREEGAGAPPW